MEEELIIEIGQILKRAAVSQDVAWDYAGYMFETRDGSSSGGEIFLFSGSKREDFDLSFDDQDEIIERFKRLREVTRVEGDAYWIKCLAVVRSDGDMKLLFEFDDWSRWKITPANVDRALAVLVGDVYPDALGTP